MTRFLTTILAASLAIAPVASFAQTTGTQDQGTAPAAKTTISQPSAVQTTTAQPAGTQAVKPLTTAKSDSKTPTKPDTVKPDNAKTDTVKTDKVQVHGMNATKTNHASVAKTVTKG